MMAYCRVKGSYRAILVPTLITQICAGFSQMIDYRGFFIGTLGSNPLKRTNTDSILNNAKVYLLLLEKDVYTWPR